VKQPLTVMPVLELHGEKKLSAQGQSDAVAELEMQWPYEHGRSAAESVFLEVRNNQVRTAEKKRAMAMEGMAVHATTLRSAAARDNAAVAVDISDKKTSVPSVFEMSSDESDATSSRRLRVKRRRVITDDSDE
jgi:hypothetical protein